MTSINLKQVLNEKVTQLGWPKFILLMLAYAGLFAGVLFAGWVVMTFVVLVIETSPTCLRSIC